MDRKAELERKKQKLQQIRDDKEKRRKEKEQRDVNICLTFFWLKIECLGGRTLRNLSAFFRAKSFSFGAFF